VCNFNSSQAMRGTVFTGSQALLFENVGVKVYGGSLAYQNPLGEELWIVARALEVYYVVHKRLKSFS